MGRITMMACSGRRYVAKSPSHKPSTQEVPLRRLEPQGYQPCPTLPPLLLVTPRQFHVHAQVAVQVGLCAVEVEVADGDAAQVAAYARVDGFADDAVHAGERADVDDTGRALPRQTDGLPAIEHHLAERAVPGQILPGSLQNLVNV